MKYPKLTATFLFFCLLSAGCIRVDYMGQRFPETPMSREVKYFTSEEREETDMTDYLLIGRFTIRAKDDTDGYEIQKKLLEKSREYGGDAVCLVSYKSEEQGVYTRNQDEFGVHPGRPQSPEEEKFFGKPVPLDEERSHEKRLTVKALLYKKRADALKLLDY